MSNAPIYDITRFTTVDYPNHLAAIFWFAKCNMRCSFCYNPQIVNGNGSFTFDIALRFLKKRKGMLDGVVLSGGEATLHLDKTYFLEEIKDMGYAIKLDTNGLRPSTIKNLIDRKLIDYIALDYKAPENKFNKITAVKSNTPFLETLEWLIKINFPFEVRTTVHSNLLTEDDINTMISHLKNSGYTNTYYLQEFLDTGLTLGNLLPPTKSFNKSNLSNELEVVWR